MSTSSSKLKDTPVLDAVYPVAGMSCAACASSVETILKNTPGVHDAQVNFAANEVLLEFDENTSPEALKKALRNVGYDLLIDPEVADENDISQPLGYERLKKRLILSAILTVPVFTLGMFFPEWVWGVRISMLLTALVLIGPGRSFFVTALGLAKMGRTSMDTLVALSTSVAFVFSVFNTIFPDYWISRGLEAHVYYETAAVIITLIMLGKLLEARAKFRTSSALKKLIKLQPKTCMLIIEEQLREVPTSWLKPGDQVRVRAGESIPVDAVVSQGESYINESFITGESAAVHKKQGAHVYAGSINQKGVLEITVLKAGRDSLLAQMIDTVHKAQSSKAPVQNLVDRISSIFIPAVLGIAVLSFSIWMVLGGQDAFSHALLTSIAILVIACPCALGLATPTALMVGMGKSAENGILIRDAQSLELAKEVDVLILDKTGTITSGKPTVTNTHWPSGSDATGFKKDLLALELSSTHPVATALVKHLKETGIQASDIHDFKEHESKGVTAVNSRGRSLFAGSRALLEKLNITLNEELSLITDEWSKEAKTVVFAGEDFDIKAVWAIRDTIKEDARESISELQSSGVEVRMLTGDHEESARAIAEEVGINFYRAGLSPQDKSKHIRQLQEKDHTVAMVGDGINDSEALALADLSIAMAHGSDIAMEVAQITLVRSDLKSIPKAIKISRRTVKTIRENLFWAFIYNLVGIPLAAGLLYPVNGFLLDPMIAGAAMAFSSVSVVLNSLRLKNLRI